MRVKTRYGDWEIEEEKIIFMEGPILGFEKIRRYALLSAGAGVPFYWLQAVDEPAVAFLVVEPKVVCPTYDPDLERICGEMEIFEDDDLALLSILTIREHPFSASVNLRAPLVLNVRTKKGRQIVLEDERFPVRYAVEAIKVKEFPPDSFPPKGIESLTGEIVKHCG